MEHNNKYQIFIRLIEDSQKNGVQVVIIDHPQVLGDSYSELIENLGKLADAGLLLAITRRGEKSWDSEGHKPSSPRAS